MAQNDKNEHFSAENKDLDLKPIPIIRGGGLFVSLIRNAGYYPCGWWSKGENPQSTNNGFNTGLGGCLKNKKKKIMTYFLVLSGWGFWLK